MKEQYIRQVSRALAVPRKQKNDILRDLEEAFASAKEHGETEEQVIERLGEPSEFAAGMSEINAADKKRLKPKTIATILCALVAVAVIGTLSGIYLPKLFKFGNPIPYLKAAKLITEENHFAIVEDKSTGSVVIISKDPSCHDVLGYIYQNSGLTQSVEYILTATGIYNREFGDETYSYNYIDYAHGSDATYHVTLDTFMDKYGVWNIPAEIFELPQNHEMLDLPNSTGREGLLINLRTKSQVHMLFGEPDVSDENKEVYYDCFGEPVTFTYSRNNNITLISKNGRVLLSSTWESGN